jgi:hypothetical protein
VAPPDHRALAVLVLRLSAAVSVGACGDEVVGQFDASGGMEGGGTSGTPGTDGGTLGSTLGSTSTTGDPDVFVGPGCFSDDFEDGVIDESRWYTWVEGDSHLEEIAGMLKFTPPSTGLLDTGVVGSLPSRFRFDDGRVRVRVPMPPVPTRPVVVFLQVLEETDTVVSISLGENNLAIGARQFGIEQYFEVFPTDPYPQWIALRAEGPLVHFETSDDGITYTTLTTRDKISSFDVAAGLLMAQTYGDDFQGGVVAVDDFEVCLF